ncbi:MAG: hypothetical protein ACK5TR_06775 [Alphaproteobacteria bacterium]
MAAEEAARAACHKIIQNDHDKRVNRQTLRLAELVKKRMVPIAKPVVPAPAPSTPVVTLPVVAAPAPSAPVVTALAPHKGSQTPVLRSSPSKGATQPVGGVPGQKNTPLPNKKKRNYKNKGAQKKVGASPAKASSPLTQI